MGVTSENRTNYHSHCTFCDGRAPIEEFVKEAIRQGFRSYGISSHAPLTFPTHWTLPAENVEAYIQEVRRVQACYQDQIELYLGMEIDYLNRDHNPSSPYFQTLPLDFRIGSVHMMRNLEGEYIDTDTNATLFAENLKLHFQNDLRGLVERYIHKMMRMVERGGFDFVGHADKMIYNAGCCDPTLPHSSWYKALIREYFTLIAERGVMMEINTKKFTSHGVFFPSCEHFALIRELHIPVLVNSDAHLPAAISQGRSDALHALRESGIRSVVERYNGAWQEVPIADCYA
ncbi:MAG: histidinol-phosphatase [Alistipes sp.]|nr:histidinol-phosphatase [Alistipes sp.]